MLLPTTSVGRSGSTNTRAAGPAAPQGVTLFIQDTRGGVSRVVNDVEIRADGYRSPRHLRLVTWRA
jgi:hypothetical protein